MLIIFNGQVHTEYYVGLVIGISVNAVPPPPCPGDT